MEICKSIVIECTYNDLSGTLLDKVVKKGQKLTENCEIRLCNPQICRVDYYTSIYIRNVTKTTIEERDEYKIVKLDGDINQFYIYPKETWDKLQEYIDRIRDDLPPKTPGLILHGPPGVGKTSFAEIVANASGIEISTIKTSDILSKYVGESEKNLAKIFTDVMNKGKGILLFDDAEWILMSRNFANATDNNMGLVDLNLTELLLNFLPEIKRSELPILVIATTNVSITNIDPALIRPERFGKPVLIPLPDYKALKLYLDLSGISNDESDKWARYLASHGANFDDARRFVEEKKDGKEFKLETIKGRGYIRIAPERILEVLDKKEFEDGMNTILRVLGLTEYVFKSKFARLMFNGPSRFWLPIINELSLRYGHGSILLNHPRFVEEAVMTANESKQAIIAPISLIGFDATQYINSNSETPVFFIASDLDISRGFLPEGVGVINEAVKFLESVVRNEKLKYLVTSIILSYYGINYTKDSLKKFLNMITSRSGIEPDRILMQFLLNINHVPVDDDLSKMDYEKIRFVAYKER